MKKHLTLFITSTLTACSFTETNLTTPSLCTIDWFNLVEEKIPTNDKHGHGPDLGSEEWRSVVEFKLGIRNKHEVPPLETDQWCRYINDHFIARD